MPALILFITCVLYLSCARGIAHAEGTTEIRQKRGLFLYEGFQHWVNLEYEFNDNESRQGNTKSTSSNHTFKESYNASLQVALFDPHIFDSILQGSIVSYQVLNKNDTSSSSSNINTYQYNFSGSGLDMSRTPFTLLSFRNINTVQNTFSAPTTYDSTGNEFEISLLNKLLRSKFHFARNAVDTSNGDTTSSTVSNSYSYTAAHSYKGFSETNLTLGFSDQSGGGSNGPLLNTSTTSLMFDNGLLMGPQQKYSLQTSIQLKNTVTDTLPQRFMNFGEVFSVILGRALNLTTNYNLSNTSYTDFAGQVHESTKNLGEAVLKHKLFDSVETQLRGKVSFEKLNDGTENRIEAEGSVRYSKILPADSRILLGIVKGYALTDRRVGSATTTVIDELHAGVHQGDAINLALADGTISSVVSVKSRNPVFTYVEGVDYTVNLALGRIDILSGGGVRIDPAGTGMDLYISYTIFKDPQVKYSTNYLSLSSQLGLFRNKFLLGASYFDSEQTLINGPVTNSLQNSRMMTLYAGGIYDKFNYRLSYRNSVVGNLASQSIEGNGTANWYTQESAYSLGLHDSFSKYDASLTAVGYSENEARLIISYSRNVLSNMRLTVNANVIDTRSDLRSPKDSLSLRSSYLILLNSTTINLSGQTAWSFFNGGITRDDSAHIDITRYF